MANYEEAWRTNYVKIKDTDKLTKALEPFDIEVWANDGFTAFGGTYEGGFPQWGEDSESEEIEFSFAEHVCPFMEEDQILIAMSVGHEKLRYVSGWAQAYNQKGEFIQIALFDIYKMASDKFGVPLNSINAAEY